MGLPDPEPDTGINPQLTAGIAFNEAFRANVQAGFSEAQSLYLVAVQITGNPGIAPGSNLEQPPEVPDT